MKSKQLYRVHANICQSLTHPTRLEIVDCLRDGEKNVTKLVKELGTPQESVSRHLRMMRSTGIVLSRREGTSVYYRLGSPKIIAAYDLMHRYSQEYLSSTAALASGENNLNSKLEQLHSEDAGD